MKLLKIHYFYKMKKRVKRISGETGLEFLDKDIADTEKQNEKNVVKFMITMIVICTILLIIGILKTLK